MFGSAGGSILDVKPYMGQNGHTCNRCGGNGWLKKYGSKAEWYGNNRPNIVIETFQCPECEGYGYIKTNRNRL